MIGEPCCDNPKLVGDGRVKRCTSCDGFYIGDVRAAEPVARLERSRAKSRTKPAKRAAAPKAARPAPPQPSYQPDDAPTINQHERRERVARRQARIDAPHCDKCGLRDVHWPGCPNIGTDERSTLQGSTT